MVIDSNNVDGYLAEVKKALEVPAQYKAGQISKKDALFEIGSASMLAYRVDAFYKFKRLGNPLVGKYYLSDVADNLDNFEKEIMNDGKLYNK